MKTSISAASTQKNSESTPDAQPVNRPEKKFKAGPVSATIWKNRGQSSNGAPAEYKTISLERSYKDKTGEWKYTSSLRINDLPKASVALQKAFEYLVIRSEPTVL